MHIYTFYLTDTEEPNACCNNVLHFLQFKNTIPNHNANYKVLKKLYALSKEMYDNKK